MIHSSYLRPHIFPLNGDVSPAEIDRAQTIDPTETLNRERVEEIGRKGAVGYIKRTGTIGYRLVQFEHASMEFFRKLTNKGSGVATLDLNDFKDSTFDICAYLTDDADVFKGTIWYPQLRTSGFTLGVADPDAIIERTFDFVGEKAIIWQGSNRYFIYNEHRATSSADNTIDLTAIPPVEDPDKTGVFILRVLRVRAGVTTTLLDPADYSYDSAINDITIVSIEANDIIKVYYTSATAPTVMFTPNDVDPAGLLADSMDVYLYIPASGKPSAADYVYRLQNAAIDVRFDREDAKELGSRKVQQRGIRTSTVTVTLGRILDNFSVEEVLRGQVPGYGKIDIDKLSDRVSLILKFYEDASKTVFKYGVKLDGLSPTELRAAAGVNAYVTKDATLEGEELILTTDASILGV